MSWAGQGVRFVKNEASLLLADDSKFVWYPNCRYTLYTNYSMVHHDTKKRPAYFFFFLSTMNRLHQQKFRVAISFPGLDS